MCSVMLMHGDTFVCVNLLVVLRASTSQDSSPQPMATREAHTRPNTKHLGGGWEKSENHSVYQIDNQTFAGGNRSHKHARGKQNNNGKENTADVATVSRVKRDASPLAN